MTLQLKLPALYVQSAFAFLRANCELSPDQIQSCFRHGAVWIEQPPGKPERLHDTHFKIRSGMTLYLNCNEFTLSDCPYQPTLVQDFDSFSVWNKPCGMLSQGSKWGDHWTLARWIELNHWPQRKCFIVHRLDRFTRGLMLVAHNQKTSRALHRAFAERRVKKVYRALVNGLLQPDEQQRIEQPIDERDACTEVNAIEHSTTHGMTLIEARPLTGRKHQLRIHLAGIGHPVVGDRQHGSNNQSYDLQLQAYALAFAHPHDGTPINLTLPDSELLSWPDSGKLAS